MRVVRGLDFELNVDNVELRACVCVVCWFFLVFLLLHRYKSTGQSVWWLHIYMCAYSKLCVYLCAYIYGLTHRGSWPHPDIKIRWGEVIKTDQNHPGWLLFGGKYPWGYTHEASSTSVVATAMRMNEQRERLRERERERETERGYYEDSVQTSLAEADHYPKRLTPKLRDHYLQRTCYNCYGVLCSFTHLRNPDCRKQNLITFILPPLPLHKMSLQSVHTFFSNVAYRQTDKMNQRYRKHNLLCQGGSYCMIYILAEGSLGNTILIIHDSVESDTGSYTCIATDQQGNT